MLKVTFCLLTYSLIMFKFNFGEKDSEKGASADQTARMASSRPGEPVPRAEAKEHFLSESHLVLLGDESVPISTYCYGDGTKHVISHLEPPVDSEGGAAAASAASASAQHSDLVPGVYEGGMKIWECSRDLTEYLGSREDMADLRRRQVLELGCGAGLPGLHCLAASANVDFQDYNDDVLERLTMPNVLLNAPEGGDGDAVPETRFFSGDWSRLGAADGLLEEGAYDLILTSETIYSLDSQQALLTVLSRCLKEGGKVLLAAKTHYFGVGGGLRQFEEKLRGDGGWEYRTVLKVEDGVKREIIEIQRRKKAT